MIPISKPIIAKNAKKYLLECLKSGWVSSKGEMVKRFEKAFALFVGTKHAVATSSGTAALHLSLTALGVGKGDEVIVPALTMIAAVLPVLYVGATPVLVDCEKDTGNIDPQLIEAKITAKTKAIIVVHLNGHPADFWPILKLARKYHLKVVEDAAESHGARYQLNNSWEMVGSIGDLGCFSFYGNKLVTCGEGGMVTTNSRKLAERISSLRNLARSKQKHFFHKEIAFTYRMSSLQAALGLAQLEEAKRFLELKTRFASIYSSNLQNLTYLKLPSEKTYCKRIYWNYDVLIPNNKHTTRDKLAKYLEKRGVESRIFVIPMHQQPAFIKLGLFKGEKYPVAEKLSKQGLSLPLGLTIKEGEINQICQLIHQVFQ